MAEIIHIKTLRARKAQERKAKIMDEFYAGINGILLSSHSKVELIKDVLTANYSDTNKVTEIKEILKIKS